MKTLYKEENLTLNDVCTYYEIVMHNSHKFRIYIELTNSICVGFNGNCCLSIMDNNGVWKHIVDNRELGKEFNVKLYYSRDTILKDNEFIQMARVFKNYIEKVYA